MPELIQEATGFDATDFLVRYAYGREDVPLSELLEPQGITLSWVPAKNDLGLGARIRNAQGQCTIATVYEGEAAHQAGLSAGDTFVAIEGLKVTDEKSLRSLLSRWQPGDEVAIHVFRRDELREFRLTLAAPAAMECSLQRSATAESPQGNDSPDGSTVSKAGSVVEHAGNA